MSQVDYGERKLDLVRAIKLAEGKVHSAIYEQSTGAGTPEDARKAKDHLAALKEQLDDHEVADAMAMTKAKDDRSDKARREFDAFMGDTTALLAERRGLVEAAAAGAAAIVAADARYREINDTIRDRAHQLGRLHGAQVANASNGLLMNMHDIAARAASNVLSEARFVVKPDSAPKPLPVMEFEEMSALDIRRSLVRFAPSGWEA